MLIISCCSFALIAISCQRVCKKEPTSTETIIGDSQPRNNFDNVSNVEADPQMEQENLDEKECCAQMKYHDKKNATGSFWWGIACGIIFTLLCTRHQKVKKIAKYIMKKISPQKETNGKEESSPISGKKLPEDGEQKSSTVALLEQENSSSKTIERTDVESHPSSSEKEEIEEKMEEVYPLNPFSFAVENEDWCVVGTSVIGKSHISMNLPCQDSCKYKYIGDGWGIAITSDGAGSAKRSEIGSKIVVERGVFHFEQLIERQGWKRDNKLPSDVIWLQMAYITLQTIYKELVAFGSAKGIDYKELSATIIVLIHTPHGILCTHIGDGRAGYRSESGEWKSLIIPHKGEEANQTIFITSDFWSQPNYVMSDVFVPQSIVMRECPTAFTLMSDGCEHTMWECNLYDEQKQIFFDPNRPFAKLYEGLRDTLVDYSKEQVKLQKRAENWQKFIMEGNNSLKKESDDKTLILGVLYK